MRIAVVGGGPAGMMAAIRASKRYEVSLFDGNYTLGKKLLLTGNGRCNVLNNKNNHDFIRACGNKKFKVLYSWFNRCNIETLIDFFENNGVNLIEENDNRLFPASNKANSILNVFLSNLSNSGVKIYYGHKIKDIVYQNHKFMLISDCGSFEFDKVILACGGASYRATGSDGSGFELAKRLGHEINPLFGAEVGVICQDKIIQSKLLQGVSLKDVEVVFEIGNKKYRDSGDLIFTHYGFSGPLIFKYSNLIARSKNGANLIVGDVGYQLPKSWIKFLIDSGLDMCYCFFLNDTLSLDKAFITDGGIRLSDVDVTTLESKILKNLYFCGEMLDLAAPLGGYNISIALMSGWVVGDSV